MAMHTSSSSLLERRRCSLPGMVVKKSGSFDAAEASSASTATSSTNASPEASPISPEVASMRQRRTNRPSINCALVLQDQFFADPFAHSQCQRLSEEYVGFEKLGEGSTGVVYKVQRRSDNQELALKVMRMDDKEQLANAQKEYDLLWHVSHPNIIRALDFFTYSMGAVLVLDYFAGKKLGRAVRAAPGHCFQEPTACHLTAQLLNAASHLHSCGIIHRDIKADNVLISHDLSDLRLIDFNAAKQLSEGQALTMTGTVDYMPPEVLQGDSPSQSCDIWAIGLCLYLMLDGHLPSERRVLRKSFDFNEPAAPQNESLVQLNSGSLDCLSSQCKDVVRNCLQMNCNSRPTASTVLEMPWFVGADTRNRA